MKKPVKHPFYEPLRRLKHYLAESEGFEPSIPFRGIHTFQACSFNHSDNSPIFQGCKNKCSALASEQFFCVICSYTRNFFRRNIFYLCNFLNHKFKITALIPFSSEGNRSKIWRISFKNDML